MATNDMSVDSIIKKYEQRQDLINSSLGNNSSNHMHSARQIQFSVKNLSSGRETPQFNSINHKKQKKASKETNIQKTHKKKDSHPNFHPKDVHSSQFYHQQVSKKQMEMMQVKLDKAEERLATSEKNYAEMWKKYEVLLKEGKKSGKAVELQQKLREKEASEMAMKCESYERQIKNLKECIGAKDGNLSALRDKLRQKNERIVEAERLLDDVKVELDMFKAKQLRLKEEQEGQKGERESIIDRLKEEMIRFEVLAQQKEKEKKGLLVEMEKNYISHKEELEVLRLSYKKVEDQYKEWIQSCAAQKLQIIQEYQQKLKDSQKIAAALSSNNHTVQYLEKELEKRGDELSETMTQNNKLINELRAAKMDFQNADKTKQELIIKISTLQNGMIEKVDYQRVQEDAYSKLQGLYRNQVDKNKDLTHKYSSMNSEFQQLKNKCSVMFSELEERKESKDSQALQVIRLRKEIVVCREQMERSKNNQMSLSAKLNETMGVLKGKTCKFQEEKQELMTQLLAQRLENAKVKDQLQETKVQLKKEYDISLQNTKNELQSKIRELGLKRVSAGGSDVEKEQLYLQLRELERRYELLSSEIVTVDEFMGMASKMQRRYQVK